MENPRWWDAAIAAVVATMAVIVLAGRDESGPLRLGLALAALVVFLLAYVLLGRPDLAAGTETWRAAAFMPSAIVAVGVGAAAEPMLATLQTIAFPLVWMLSPTRRTAIAMSLLLATAVMVGFGLGVAGWVSGAITAALSFAFAVALGLWISGIVEQREQNAQLVAQLRATQSQLEVLSRDRGAAQERERLARDIHDTLAQTLAGLVILAERAGRQSREGRVDGAAQTIATVESVAREALAEARALVARTAAVPAEPLLGAAVERLAERFRAETGLRIRVARVGEEHVLDREAQVVVLRCLQEALANVRKHAHAARVDVRVEVDGAGAGHHSVVDDGHGFDPDAVHPGFGLEGMRERVALAQGRLDIDSGASGTTLRVRLPAAERVTT